MMVKYCYKQVEGESQLCACENQTPRSLYDLYNKLIFFVKIHCGELKRECQYCTVVTFTAAGFPRSPGVFRVITRVISRLGGQTRDGGMMTDNRRRDLCNCPLSTVYWPDVQTCSYHLVSFLALPDSYVTLESSSPLTILLLKTPQQSSIISGSHDSALVTNSAV